jgi:membrane protein YqaA with SNARE-associated domain
MELSTELLTQPGLPLLFCLSFLAATVVPVGSEWLLVLLIVQGASPRHAVMTATLGNYLGACTTYLLGIAGSGFVMEKILRINDVQLSKARGLYRRYGIWSLLLSWLPLVGDAICFVGGMFRTNFIYFSILVFLGKLGRYATLALLVLSRTGG